MEIIGFVAMNVGIIVVCEIIPILIVLNEDFMKIFIKQEIQREKYQKLGLGVILEENEEEEEDSKSSSESNNSAVNISVNIENQR